MSKQAETGKRILGGLGGTALFMLVIAVLFLPKLFLGDPRSDEILQKKPSHLSIPLRQRGNAISIDGNAIRLITKDGASYTGVRYDQTPTIHLRKDGQNVRIGKFQYG